MIGGYGLFGVILEVTLLTSPNHTLIPSSLQLSIPDGEFHRVYQAVLSDPNVCVKIARLNILDGLETAQLIVFTKSSPTPSSSTNLGLTPRVMDLKTSLLYKWAMPALRELRYSVEKTTGQAIDMTGGQSLTRNELLFESALPLAKLYDSLLVSDDTFVLQEFFVPSPEFHAFIELARPVYKDLADQSTLLLLNTTIRYVRRDETTALPYAPVDSYAFVLYYRIPRSKEADEALGVFHNRFAEGKKTSGARMSI